MKKHKSKIGFLVLGALAAFAMFVFGSPEAALTMATVLPVVIGAGKSSLELKQERKEVSDKIDAIKQRAESENNRDFTADEFKELRQLQDNFEKYSQRIEFQLAEEKRAASAASASFGSGASKSEEKEMRNFSLGKVIQSRLNNTPVEGLERELLDDANKEARSNNITPKGVYLSSKILDTMVEKRTMSAGSSTAGGNTIQTDKVGFFDALYAKRVLSTLGVRYMTGLSHNTDLTGLSTGVTTAWATETANAAAGDPVTASRSMTPKRLAAYIDLSNQLLIQNPQLEGYIMNSFMESIYVAVEAAYINGSGSAGQPTGLLGTSGIQDVAIGTNGGAPTLAKILELVQKLGTANANVENVKFLINPKVEAKLKQTPIDSGSGAMIMAYQQYFAGTPNVIDGKITGITSNVPSNLTKGTADSVCSAIIAGDFSKSVIGQFGGMDMIIDPYSQAIGGKVRIVGNTFWDMAFEQPAVFGAILDATTT